MKRLFHDKVLLIGVILIYLIMTRFPTQAQSEPRFTSLRFGITFNHPVGWFISNNPGLIDILNPTDSIASIEGTLQAGISLKLYHNPNNLTLNQVAYRLYQQNLSTITADVTMLHIEPLTLDNSQIDEAILVQGIPAWSTDYFVMISVGDKVYICGVNTTFLPNFEQKQTYYQKILRDLLNTARFIPPTWEGYSLNEPVAVAATVVADEFSYTLGDPETTKWGLLQAFNNFFDNPRYESYHAAEDWYQRGGPTAGEPVYAVADGVVKYASFANYPGDVVIITHLLPTNEIWYSMYGHLGSHSVNQGDTVQRGDEIGTIYDWADNSHLHFEIRNFYIADEINGADSALKRHRNYPPGPGYWPVGTFKETDERPLDRGWAEPLPFIRARQRYQSVLPNSIYGQIKLQGRVAYSDTRVLATLQPCETSQVTSSSVVSQAVRTNIYGYFEFASLDEEVYQCIQITHQGFLSANYPLPEIGDIGSITLLNGDVTGDNIINIFDMALIGSQYGTTSNHQTDLNLDGQVNIFDIALAGNNYTKRGPLTTWE